MFDLLFVKGRACAWHFLLIHGENEAQGHRSPKASGSVTLREDPRSIRYRSTLEKLSPRDSRPLRVLSRKTPRWCIVTGTESAQCLVKVPEAGFCCIYTSAVVTCVRCWGMWGVCPGVPGASSSQVALETVSQPNGGSVAGFGWLKYVKIVGETGRNGDLQPRWCLGRALSSFSCTWGCLQIKEASDGGY